MKREHLSSAETLHAENLPDMVVKAVNGMMVKCHKVIK